MRLGTIPPAAIGLAAGLLTSAAAIALSATGLLPVWITTSLLFFAGGLAAGLASPVRPMIGALLGGLTGLFTAVLTAVVTLMQWSPGPNQYITPPPPFLIALMLMIFYVPSYAVAGAAGSVLRGLLFPAGVSNGSTPRRPSERRQGAAIATGTLAVLAGIVAYRLTGWIDPAPVFLIFSVIGGLAAGLISASGARTGAGAGLLAGVCALGVQTIFFIAQASTSPATGDGVPEGLWPIAIAIMAFWVLPAVMISGALGGTIARGRGAET